MKLPESFFSPRHFVQNFLVCPPHRHDCSSKWAIKQSQHQSNRSCFNLGPNEDTLSTMLLASSASSYSLASVRVALFISRRNSCSVVARTRVPPATSTATATVHLPRIVRRYPYPRTFASGTAQDSGSKASSWWNSAELWGGLGALAGWGMSGAALYDAANQGPEVISLTMTPVLIVYSTLFARWAWVVKPQNLLLCSCHVTNVAAQLNQLRRALEFQIANGGEDRVRAMGERTAVGGAVLAGSVLAGPSLRSKLIQSNLGAVSAVAASDAGPFTVHFWAPMSKWFISGASFLDLHRPTDQVSLPQYTALTLTGFFFSRYALLVTPINYTLCSVNIALFLSSAWHLGRKVNADYLGGGTTSPGKSEADVNRD